MPPQLIDALEPTGPVVVVPLKTDESILGLIVADNKFTGSPITRTVQEGLLTLADLSAPALEHARWLADVDEAVVRQSKRVTYLEKQDSVVREMAGCFETAEVVEKAVSGAHDLLEADVALLVPYDDDSQQFAFERAFGSGISKDLLTWIRTRPPALRELGNTVIQVGVWEKCITGFSPNETSAGDLRVLVTLGVRSLRCVPLNIGSEHVGILCVGFRGVMTFLEADCSKLNSIAALAALSLKKAKLFEQLQKAIGAASVVGRLTTIGKIGPTLNSIVEAIHDVVVCDAVLIYAIDPNTGMLTGAPATCGVLMPSRVTGPSKVQAGSLVSRMLALTEPREISDVASDADFRNTRFAKDEDIRSCMVVPLRVDEAVVGVLFVNYRYLHRFTPADRTYITHFANHAAVAIKNAQLFTEQAERLVEQQTLVALSRQMLGTTTLHALLQSAVDTVRSLLGADFAHIVLPNRDDDLTLVAVAGWPDGVIGRPLPRGAKSHAGYTIDTKAPVYVADYEHETHFDPPPIAAEFRIRSGQSVPMFAGQEVIGALLVATAQQRHFSASEVSLLSLIANQTAIGLSRAESFESLERRNAHLQALLNAGAAIAGATSSSATSSVNEVLKEIVRQAVKCLESRQAGEILLGEIQLYDKESESLTFACIHEGPGAAIRVSLNDKRRIDESSPEHTNGITGRCVLRKVTCRVGDVTTDPDYIAFTDTTRSEVATPLMDGDYAIGVLGIESALADAFDAEDERILEGLAELAVLALRNARQYDELRDTKGLVGARTALVWMGMASNIWRHSISTSASTICNCVHLIQKKAGSSLPPGTVEYLDMIKSLAEQILAKPITAPLSSEEGTSVIDINALVQERVAQLSTTREYSHVEFQFSLAPVEALAVHVSPEWLRRAFDVVTDNAARELHNVPADRRSIFVRTREHQKHVEISFSDRGRGMSPEVLQQLFRGKIRKTAEADGLGVGLLMAQAIIETYGGKILVESCRADGTTVTFRMPRFEFTSLEGSQNV